VGTTLPYTRTSPTPWRRRAALHHLRAPLRELLPLGSTGWPRIYILPGVALPWYARTSSIDDEAKQLPCMWHAGIINNLRVAASAADYSNIRDMVSRF